MSRDIDTSDLDELDVDDLRYLRDRGMLTSEQELEYLPEDVEAAMDDSGPLPAGGASAPASTVLLPADGDSYDQMNKKELQEDAEDRGLAKTGTVVELIQRLRQNDLDANSNENS